MLNQLVYTRCSPHRDLKNKGNVVRGDGFGVFSLSAELFNDVAQPGLDFLQQRLPVKNGSNETSPIGLFDSYEYFSISEGKCGFVFEHSRPHCKVPRKNGQAHRTGTYIKQCLVGEIEGYPYEWFGCDAWTAYKKSENDYYLDEPGNPGPDLLPQVSAKPRNGNISLDQIKSFVGDGRRDAVKAAIWFLIQEYAKPEGERRVLLIKDNPENVVLWVAAIECAFSPEMAGTITFATNRTKLGTQADATLFYYTDAAGRVSQIQNRSIQQTRRPYCMIVGYHPKDTFCAALKPMPTSNFVLIDGTTKTTSFQADTLINRPYFNAVLQYNDDILDFCRVILPSLKLTQIGPHVVDLYDAYKYLLDSTHKGTTWRYAEALSHMNRLVQYGVPQNAALLNYLLDESIAAYPRFIADDIGQNFQLMGHLLQFAKKTRREQELVALVMDYTQGLLANIATTGSSLQKLWPALKAPQMAGIVKPVLCNLFNDTELNFYAKQFMSAPPSVVDTILEMYETMMSQNAIPHTEILASNEKYAFVCIALGTLLKDPRVLNKHIAVIRQTPKLLNAAALSVADYLNKTNPQRTADWWEVVIVNCGENLTNLCMNLSRSGKASIDLIEQLLTIRLEKARMCDAQLIQAFAESIKILGLAEDTGMKFFGAWVKMSTPMDHNRIIQAAQTCKLSKNVSLQIFNMLDNLAPYSVGRNQTYTGHGEMSNWGDRLGATASSAELASFKRSFDQARRPDAAIAAISKLISAKLPLKKGLTQSEYFADICEKAAKLESGEVHLYMLCAFVFGENEGSALNQYIDSYIEQVLSCYRGFQMLEGMAALTTAVTYEYKIPGRKADYVEHVQNQTEKRLVRHFAAYYKPNMLEQVTKMNKCAIDVKEKLITLLKAASKHATPQSGGFFGGLFGKR